MDTPHSSVRSFISTETNIEYRVTRMDQNVGKKKMITNGESHKYKI